MKGIQITQSSSALHSPSPSQHHANRVLLEGVVLSHANRHKNKDTFVTPSHGLFETAEEKNIQYQYNIVQYTTSKCVGLQT
jgi:hypothetical protein